MAHIQRRQHGHGVSWRVMFRINHRIRSRSFANPVGAAEFGDLVDRVGGEAALEILELRRGRPADTRVPTVAQALTEHVEALSGITEGTRADYQKMTDQFADSYIGDLPIDIVTTDLVNKWVRAESRHLSAKTIRNRHGLLYAAMKRQVKGGVIPGNPCDDVKIGRDEQVEMTILTSDELGQILDHLKLQWRGLVITLAGTGLRIGEATALQVRDVDLEHDPPVLRVARAWKHTNGHGHQLGAPKTQRGRRTVSLPPEVVAVTHPLVADRPGEAFVFTNLRGSPIRQNSFHEVWTTAVRKSGIGKRPRLHDLRHSHASWLIAAGVPLNVVQRRLGHESIKTTVDIYGGLADDALSIAAQAASLALSPAMPDRPPLTS